MAGPAIFKRIEKPEGNALAASVIAFAVTSAFYLATMSRTCGFIDRGELAAVASTLGIAHPTGYPTLTLLGHLTVKLFPSMRPVLVLNALSALWTASGVALTVLAIDKVVRMASMTSIQGSQQASFWSATFVAFSTTWWSQATGFEVYSLHAVFLTLVTLTFFKYLDDLGGSNGRARFSRSGVLFSLSLGLAFTNHLSMVMLAPAFLYLFFRTTGFRAQALWELTRLVPGFVVGLLPYAYLPLRSSMHPRLNWGAPDDVERFFEHITGAQFHFAVLVEPRVFRQQLAYFLNTLLEDTSVVGLALSAVGFVYLARRARVHALWTGVLLLSCAGISGLYDINDIGNYYLPAFLAITVWLAAGLAFVAERVGRRAAFGLGAALVAVNAARHYGPMNERDDTLAEDLTWNVLENLPPNAVVISNHWDYWVSASLYAQEVEGLRPDVVVLDPEGLRSEAYLDQLQRNHPQLVKPILAQVRGFVDRTRELREQPTMTPAQADAYYASYYAMLSALIERNPDRPFFVTEWTDPRIGEGYVRVPTKLAYLLTKDATYLDQEFPEYRYRPWLKRVDPYVVKVAEIYTTSLLARARYEEQHGQPEQGRRYGLYALTFDPGFEEEDVPDFPLHIDDQIREVIRNYRDLRKRVQRVRGP